MPDLRLSSPGRPALPKPGDTVDAPVAPHATVVIHPSLDERRARDIAALLSNAVDNKPAAQSGGLARMSPLSLRIGNMTAPVRVGGAEARATVEQEQEEQQEGLQAPGAEQDVSDDDVEGGPRGRRRLREWAADKVANAIEKHPKIAAGVVGGAVVASSILGGVAANKPADAPPKPTSITRTIDESAPAKAIAESVTQQMLGRAANAAELELAVKVGAEGGDVKASVSAHIEASEEFQTRQAVDLAKRLHAEAWGGRVAADDSTVVKHAQDFVKQGLRGVDLENAIRADVRLPAELAAPGGARAFTAGMNEAQKFDFYRSVIEKGGGAFDPARPNIIGVRHATDADVNGGESVYDDTFAVLWQDQAGPHVVEVAGNTDPSARYRGEMGQDGNGDGRIDQGRLRPGHYQYVEGTFQGRPALRMLGDSPVDRDVNQNGVFLDDGGAATDGGGNSMLFHVGGVAATWSAGCLTMAPAEYAAFMDAVRAAGLDRAPALFTLVDGAMAQV